MENNQNLKGPNKVGLFHEHEDIADGKGNFKDGWSDGLIHHQETRVTLRPVVTALRSPVNCSPIQDTYDATVRVR